MKRVTTSPDFWIPLIVALPLLWVLLPGGLPNTADGPVHLVRSMEMIHAWQDGVLIARWSENLGYGFGLPVFVFTPPLPYYLTATFYMLGLPLEFAFKAMMAVGVLIGGYGVYWLARSGIERWPGAVAVAAFLYAPIELRELFIQGNVAQYLAWAFPPWAVWAIVGLFRREWGPGRGRYAAVLALAVAGTLLCHNVAALLAMGMIGGLVLVLLLFTRDVRAFAWSAGGSLLGLALAAWFWVPALLEGKYIALDHIVASDFRPRFIALRELLMLSPPLDTGAINPYFPLTLGAVQVWLAAVGGLALIMMWALKLPFNSKGDDQLVARATGVFFAGFGLFCSFMATEASEPVWSALPFVELFEWPLRWHGFSALALSFLCGWGVRPWRGKWASVVGIGAILLLIGSALVNLYPQKLPFAGRTPSPMEVVRYEVRSGAVGTTSLGEYNPIWVESSFPTSPLVESYLSGAAVDRLPALPPGASGAQVSSSVDRQVFALRLPEATTITLNLVYFPGWRADAGGQAVMPHPHPGSGLMNLNLPAGEYTLMLTFEPTPLRRVAELFSPLAWAGLVVAGVVSWRRRERRTRQRILEPERGGPILVPLAACIVLILALRGFAPAWFTRHSPPDTALAAKTPMRVDFGGKLRLLGVDLPPQVATPSKRVTVVAYWRALGPLDEEYGVFLHLDDEMTGESLATADQRHPSEIPTSGWATGLHVRNPLGLTVPPDAPPIRYALRVGVVERESGKLLAAGDTEAGATTVGQLWVEPLHTPKAPNGPRARFGDALYLLGMELDRERREVVLYWRADAPYPMPDSIFLHLLDDDGTRIGQADGVPANGRYPLPSWRVGQVIEDRRSLPPEADAGQVARIVVGVYDPVSGERRAAFDAEDAPLADNMLVFAPPGVPGE